MLNRNYCKNIIIIIGTWISNKLGIFMPVLGLLCILMIVDHISGMLAAKKEALDSPEDKTLGWSSKKSITGIYKKIGYIITIFVAFCIDYLIFKFASELEIEAKSNTIFGLMTSIWFIVNECISILENASRMGVNLPVFITEVLADIHNKIEK